VIQYVNYKMGESGQMDDQQEKEIPAPVLMAQNVLSALDVQERERFVKFLPGYAMQLAKQGINVTEEILCEYIREVLETPKRKNTQKREYNKIIAAFVEEEPSEFESPVLEFRYHADKGNIEKISDLITQYRGVKISGWGVDSIGYGALLEPAFKTGNLDLLKYAVQHDPELREWRISSACGHAMDNGHIDMVRYVVEELGLDLQDKYASSPLHMYVQAAIAHGHWNIAEYVLPEAFKNNFSGQDELLKYLFQGVLRSGRLDYTQKFIEMGIKGTDFDGFGLWVDAVLSSLETFKYLVEQTGFFDEDQRLYLLRDTTIQFDIEKRNCLLKSLGNRKTGLFENLKQKGAFLKAFRRAVKQNAYIEAALFAKEVGLPKVFWGEEVRQGQEYAHEWQRLVGYVPSTAGKYNPQLVKKSVFDDVIEMLKQEEITGDIAERYAYHATALFRSTDRILQYLEKWGEAGRQRLHDVIPGNQPLHDIIQNIDIPRTGSFNAKEWGDAVLQHGPAMAKLVAFADKIPSPLKSADGKRYSLARTRDEVAKYAYKDGMKNPQFAFVLRR